MKIKKFNVYSINEGLYDKAHELTDKLKDGVAICVKYEDVEKFLTILKDITWMNIPNIDSFIGGENIKFKNQKFYFVLIGDRLFHTHRPEFGGQQFEVYTFE